MKIGTINPKARMDIRTQRESFQSSRRPPVVWHLITVLTSQWGNVRMIMSMPFPLSLLKMNTTAQHHKQPRSWIKMMKTAPWLNPKTLV